MPLLFEWDDLKAQTNRIKHGVSFEEAATVFADENSLTIPDPTHSHSESRFITLGSSHNKKILVVVHTDRNEKIRIISARPASKKERQQYQE